MHRAYPNTLVMRNTTFCQGEESLVGVGRAIKKAREEENVGAVSMSPRPVH